MRREMLFSIAVTRSKRCSSIPVEAERSSKRAAVGSTRSIRRVPQRAHNSSPSSLAVLQRWQKIFPLTFAIAHTPKTKSATEKDRRQGQTAGAGKSLAHLGCLLLLPPAPASCLL